MEEESGKKRPIIITFSFEHNMVGWGQEKDRNIVAAVVRLTDLIRQHRSPFSPRFQGGQVSLIC